MKHGRTRKQAVWCLIGAIRHPGRHEAGMTSGRIKVTEQEQRTAVVQAIINSRSPLKITPGMWKALERWKRFPWFWRRRR